MTTNTHNIHIIVSSGGFLGAYAIGFMVGLQQSNNTNIKSFRGSSIGALVALMYANDIIDSQITFNKVFDAFAGYPNKQIESFDSLFDFKNQNQIQNQNQNQPKPITVVLTKTEPYFKWLDFFYLSKRTKIEITTSDIEKQKMIVLLSCRLYYPFNTYINKLIQQTQLIRPIDPTKQTQQIEPYITDWTHYYDGGFVDDIVEAGEEILNSTETEITDIILIIDLKKYSNFYIFDAISFGSDEERKSKATELYTAGLTDAKKTIKNNFEISECEYQRMLTIMKKSK